MKVLYVVSLFPCWSETFIAREILALKRNGVDIIIFSLKNAEEKVIQTDAKQLNDSIIYPAGLLESVKNNLWYCLKNLPVVSRVFFDIISSMYKTPTICLKSIVVLWRTIGILPEISKHNIDWVHAHWATFPSTSAMIISKLLKHPFSFTSHAHDIFEDNQLLNKKYDTASFGVTISEYNKDFLAKKLHRTFGDELNIIHCGVDLSKMNYQRENRHTNEILAVGRLDEIKGFRHLIEACSILKKDNINFKCKIIGDGPLKEELTALRKKLGLENHIEFLGILKQEEVKKTLEKSTMFVLPSVKTSTGNMDGIPVALMEAMATGLPVISTYVSGIPELISDGVNGFLCEQKNASALAEKVALLFNDQKLQEKFAKAARGKVEEQFSAELEAKKLLQLFIQGTQNHA